MAQDTNQNRPADVAQADSVGGMAKRLLNPAHLSDLARRSAATLKEQGAEQLWRDVTFRVGLAFHHDSWQHRADLPLRRELKAQRAEYADGKPGPVVSVVVPLYNTPEKFFGQMLASVQKQTYPHWQLVLVDASDADHAAFSTHASKAAAKDPRILYKKVENGGIAANTTAGFALATGTYIALLDHDDVLYPNALYESVKTLQSQGAELVYSDEIVLSADLKQLGGYHFKPDFAPDYLRGVNFITHLAVFSRALLDRAGAYESSEYDGAQDHDLMLRLTEQTTRDKIAHIKKVLYIWRGHAGSTAAGMEAKPYALAAGVRAIDAQLQRLNLPGKAMQVEDAPGAFQVRYELTGHPLVSVMIPNKDHIDDLDRCLKSLYANAGYDNFEVLVIENNSEQQETFAYYKTMPERYPNSRVVTYVGPFNFSAVNNLGARFAKGEHLLLLNNDVEVRNADWLPELLRQCAHPGGAAICGAELFYPDETLQHAGVITGLGGYAGHSHKYKKAGGSGYLFRTATVQDFSAVTGACLLVKTSVWDEVGGLDEAFAVAFNDVDFCLRVRDAGYRIAWTPYAQLTHYESKSRGGDEKDPAKAARFAAEQQRLYTIHGKENILDDPYYNPNLTRDREDFSESDDLRGLKAGKVTVRFRGGEA